MADLGLSYEDLKAKASDLRDAKSEDLLSLVNTINSAVVSFQDAWEGQVSQQYQEQWASMYPKFQQAAELIKALGTDAYNYAQAHEEIDMQSK